MLFMVEKEIIGGLCHSINRYVEANNKYMNNCDKTKESLHLKHWDINNLYGWAMSQKLLVNGFNWVEDLSEFNQDFIKSYNEKINEGYFLEADIQYPGELHGLHNDLPFLSQSITVERLVANLHDKS